MASSQFEADQARDPDDDVIGHYIGDKGNTYFQWQGEDGEQAARYNLHLWQPYLNPTDAVLDFGCGGGYLLNALNVAKKVGVEVNPHAREAATKLGIETYARWDQVPDQFDKVISSHALEHVPHPREVIRQMAANLKSPDSRIILLLPIDDWRTPKNRTYRPGDRDMHLYTWTPLLLGNLLASCGLTVYECRIVTHAWPPGKAMLWAISPRLFHTAAWCWAVWKRQRQLFACAGLCRQEF